MIKSTSILALSALFTLGVAACGGGGGSSATGVGGLAVDGPVKNGSIKVYNAGGTQCSAAAVTTNSDATFTVYGSSCTYPLVLELSGGTDTLHSSAGVTVPTAIMRSIVASSASSKANISPFSTLIYHALLKDKTNLTDAGLTTTNTSSAITSQAASVISAFGFGIDSGTDGSTSSGFNPVSASLGNANIATFVQASEALSETVRRTAKAAGGVSSTNITAILKTLGQDLSDDTLDGNMKKTDGTSTTVSSGITGFDTSSVRAYARSNALFVLNEIFSTTGLNITDQTGSQTSALSALKTAVAGVSGTATTSYDSVKPSSTVVSQWSDAKKTAIALLGVSALSDLGISTELTTTQTISSRGSKAVNSTLASSVADSSKVATYSGNVSAALSATSSTSATTTTSSITVGGTAIEGPVSSASIKVYNANGTECSAAATTTNSNAQFTLNIGSCTPPLAIDLSGGTDSVHSNTGGTMPQTNMRSIIGTTSQSVANISPFSTLIYYALVGDKGNLAEAQITTSNISTQLKTKATAVLSVFGFGVDSNTDGTSTDDFNPITANLGASNLATFIQASEALSETVRRTASTAGSVSSSNIGKLFMSLGQDLSDDSLDGNMRKADGSTATVSSGITGFDMANVRSFVQSNALFVLNEVFSSGGLKITDTTGTQRSALNAIKSSVTGVHSGATATFDNVKPSGIAVTQWQLAQTTAMAVLGVSSLADLGISNQLSTTMAVGARPLMVNSTLAANLTDSTKVASYSGNVAHANAIFVSAAVSAAAVASASAAARASASASASASPSASTSAFWVPLNSITLTDYPSNTATTLTPATPSISGGELIVSLPSSVSVSASNLSLLASSTTSSSATPPVLNFTLSNIPSGSGSLGVTMTLLDGSDGERTSGERKISATFSLPYSSNGTTLTLTSPSSASVSYYTRAATSAGSATLSNAAVSNLLVTSSGSNQSSLSADLKVRIAQLFNIASTHGNSILAQSLNGTSAVGNYYYSVDLSGPTFTGIGPASNVSNFSRVKGTFSAR
ncbi:MAG: hypothetical protein HQL76_00995 [Magnetococcales bacterium]|nr:hypothetical protein [Magnetococcales bacterium]